MWPLTSQQFSENIYFLIFSFTANDVTAVCEPEASGVQEPGARTGASISTALGSMTSLKQHTQKKKIIIIIIIMLFSGFQF